MDSFPLLTTERLVLRNYSEADVAAVHDIFSRAEVIEFYDCAAFTGIKQSAQLVSNTIARNAANGERGWRWGIALSSQPNELIGSCSVHAINRKFQSAELGYELHPAHWGKGLACEAASCVLHFCFSNEAPFSFNRIAATTDLDSVRSIALLKRLGFLEEGVLRQYGYWKNEFHDVRMFSVLRQEWLIANSSRVQPK